MTTPLEFAKYLLEALQLPVSDNNLEALVRAEKTEGGHWSNAARYNPLNTTQSMPGGHSVTSIGVKAYSSWDEGLAATVKSLKNGLYNGILNSLAQSAPPDETLKQMALSPWGWYYFDRGDGQRYYQPPGDKVILWGAIAPVSAYASYANTPDPVGGSISGGTTSLLKKLFYGVLLIGGGLFVWNKTK